MNNNEQVLEDFYKTMNLLKHRNYLCCNTFENISQVYPFTNEYIKEYMKKINLKDKKVLTVTASGDQVIMSMLKKAKQIDTFDCNKLTYYHLFFKLAAIKALTKEEFLNLYNLYETSQIIFYKKLRDFINKEDVKLYWDNFFKYGNDYFNYFFYYLPRYPKFENVFYLDEEIFYKAKNIIHDNINFKNIDIKDISSTYKKEKYDFINLSNIIDYENLDNFVNIVNSIINNNLINEGLVLTSYLWNKTNTLNIYYRNLLKNNCNPIIVPINTKKTNSTYEKNSIILCKK